MVTRMMVRNMMAVRASMLILTNLNKKKKNNNKKAAVAFAAAEGVVCSF